MKNTLVISGHTDLSASVANKTILETIAQRLPQAEIVRLDSLYPDFKIDAQAEQQRLLKADVIVLQFPVFWYSAPSLLERWMEETFRHGFSHGSTGDKLKGKKLVLSFTTGAPGGDVFPRRADGLHDRRIPALLQGHLQTVRDGVCRICLHRRGELWCADDARTGRSAESEVRGTCAAAARAARDIVTPGHAAKHPGNSRQSQARGVTGGYRCIRHQRKGFCPLRPTRRQLKGRQGKRMTVWQEPE